VVSKSRTVPFCQAVAAYGLAVAQDRSIAVDRDNIPSSGQINASHVEGHKVVAPAIMLMAFIHTLTLTV
jgi:hypothetical protein